MIYIPDYPRPQAVRPSWLLLNGAWEFAFDDDRCGLTEDWVQHFPCQHQIQVPFTYETTRSGIGDPTVHPVVWYARSVQLSQAVTGRLLMHFEGVDYNTQLCIIYV